MKFKEGSLSSYFQPELINHNSPEKALLKDAFSSLSYMDVWICSIIEGYIYKKVIEIEWGCRGEYTTRYDKREGEFKWWRSNGQLALQYYFKNDKIEGEYKWWDDSGDGRLWQHSYWKDGNRVCEYKEWIENIAKE